MYKDKAKQREANKLQMRRARAAKSNTKQAISQSNTGYPRVTDQEFTRLLSADIGAPIVRVSKPGDADYVPQCETTKAFVDKDIKCYEDLPAHVQREVGSMPPDTYARRVPKRGLDIKVFEDLPPDVQHTIRTVSESNEEFQRRVGIAIAYQHTFPGRY
jgi:hypothetical protein